MRCTLNIKSWVKHIINWIIDLRDIRDVYCLQITRNSCASMIIICCEMNVTNCSKPILPFKITYHRDQLLWPSCLTWKIVQGHNTRFTDRGRVRENVYDLNEDLTRSDLALWLEEILFKVYANLSSGCILCVKHRDFFYMLDCSKK